MLAAIRKAEESEIQQVGLLTNDAAGGIALPSSVAQVQPPRQSEDGQTMEGTALATASYGLDVAFLDTSRIMALLDALEISRLAPPMGRQNSARPSRPSSSSSAHGGAAVPNSRFASGNFSAGTPSAQTTHNPSPRDPTIGVIPANSASNLPPRSTLTVAPTQRPSTSPGLQMHSGHPPRGGVGSSHLHGGGLGTRGLLKGVAAFPAPTSAAEPTVEGGRSTGSSITRPPTNQVAGSVNGAVANPKPPRPQSSIRSTMIH
jgi:hypothetical protein